MNAIFKKLVSISTPKLSHTLESTEIFHMNSNGCERLFIFCIALIGLLIFSGLPASASPTQLTYQGRILKQDGTPLQYNNVSFIFQIVDPSGQCVIYQEQLTGVNMTNSGGVFDTPIGSGSVSYPLVGSFSILDAFKNTSTFTCGACSGYSCTDSSSTYTASNSDARKLRVQFHDGVGWNTISPDNVIRSVPFAGYALSAQKLGNNIASDFLIKAGLPTCSSGTFLSWDGSALTCAGVSSTNGGTVTNVTSTNSYMSVANGSSTPALTLNVGQVANTVAAGNDTRIVNAMQTGAAAGGDLTGSYPNPSITSLQGKSFSISSLTSGQALLFNGTNWINSTLSSANLSDSGNLIKAGQMPANCSAGQTLTFSSPSGAWVCSNISLTDSQITYASQSANKFLASPTSGNGAPTFRAIDSSDLPSGTITGSGSPGYLPYYSTNSSLANSPLYTTGGNVGIGTSTPLAKLHTVDEGIGTWFIDNYSSAVGNNPAIIGRKAGGNAASPIAATNGQLLLFLGGRGYYGSDFTSTSKASISMTANEDWSNTNQGSRITFATTANGTTSSSERMRIDNNGNIGIGTSTPSTSLEVRGSGITLSSSSIGTALFFKPEDQGNNYTNTIDQRQFQIMTTAIGTDFGYKFSWRNADGSNRQDALTFAKNGNVNLSANVGIGTNSPASKLHIAASTPTSSTSPLFALGNAPFDGTSGGFFNGSATGTVIGINNSSGYTGDFLNFQLAGASKFKIDNSGNITSNGNVVSSGNTTSSGNYTTTGNISTTGAGTITSAGGIVDSSTMASTSSSTGALVVSGGVGVGGAIYSGASVNASTTMTAGTSMTTPIIYGGSATNSTLTLAGTSNASPSNANIIMQPNSGNVGIGTASPLAKFEVYTGNANAANGIVISQAGSTNSGRLFFWDAQNSLGNAISRNTTNLIFTTGAVPNSTTGTTRMVLTDTGNVGIGTTTPSAPLHVNHTTITGTISSSGTTVTGTGTNFTTAFAVGDLISSAAAGAVTGQTQVITAIASDTSLTTSVAFSPALPAGTTANRVGAIFNSGWVGIGTSTPQNALNIGTGGSLQIGSSTDSFYSALYANGLSFNRNGPSYINQGTVGGNIQIRTSNVASVDTAAMTFTANGNIGIGTTSPLSKLDVSGPVAIGTFAGTTAAPSNSLTVSNQILVGQGTSQTGIFNQYTSVYNFTPRLQVSGTTADGSSMSLMQFQGGNGAGANLVFAKSRSGTLGAQSIVSSGDEIGNLQFQGSDGTNFLQTAKISAFVTGTPATGDVASELRFSTRAPASGGLSQRMVIDNSGNVGIGTTTPNYPFTLSTTNGNAAYLVSNNTVTNFNIDNSNTGVSATRFYSNGTAKWSIGNNGNNNNVLQISASSAFGTNDYLTINNGTGNVGVGTTTPAYKLDVNGDANIASGSALRFGGTSVCTSAGCTSSSDRTLKEHIQPLQGSLDKVLKLQGVEYDYKDKAKFTDKHQVGVIAQDVEKVYPEVVQTDAKTGLKSVAYDHLVAPLIEAFKSLYGRVLSVENHQTIQVREIASMKAENEQLKQENIEIKNYLCQKDPAAPFCKK